jgi:hypothetical protein
MGVEMGRRSVQNNPNTFGGVLRPRLPLTTQASSPISHARRLTLPPKRSAHSSPAFAVWHCPPISSMLTATTTSQKYIHRHFRQSGGVRSKPASPGNNSAATTACRHNSLSVGQVAACRSLSIMAPIQPGEGGGCSASVPALGHSTSCLSDPPPFSFLLRSIFLPLLESHDPSPSQLSAS